MTIVIIFSALFGFLIIHLIVDHINTKRRWHWIPVTKLDGAVPLWPAAIVPYFLLFPLTLVILIYLCLNSEIAYLSRVATHLWSMVAVAFVIYLSVPTRVVRVLPQSDSNWYGLYCFWYKHIPPHNAFPSLHVAFPVFFALHAQTFWPWLIVALAVASVLLTKAHYLIDILAGLLVGWLFYAIE